MISFVFSILFLWKFHGLDLRSFGSSFNFIFLSGYTSVGVCFTFQESFSSFETFIEIFIYVVINSFFQVAFLCFGDLVSVKVDFMYHTD